MSERWVEVADGVSVLDKGQKPYIEPKHIDGPVLVMRSGEMHWLTTFERIYVQLGLETAWSLEHKHRPGLRAKFGEH